MVYRSGRGAGRSSAVAGSARRSFAASAVAHETRSSSGAIPDAFCYPMGSGTEAEPDRWAARTSRSQSVGMSHPTALAAMGKRE
jgi:hypothetical protein